MFAYCNNNPVNNQDPTGEFLITTLIVIGAAVVGGGVAIYTGVKAREAGCDWGETILHSVMNGLMAFCTVYSFGMTAYGCYQEFCYLHGMTPVTEIGGNAASSVTIPQEAYDTYDYAQSHNGAAQDGYKGNRLFANDGRDGSEVLPSSYAPFREYDIYPKIPGIDRGAERIVLGAGSGGAAWYTPDHYRTFIQMETK